MPPPKKRKISYKLNVLESGDECGDMPGSPGRTRTSGLTFWVAPPVPSPPPVAQTLIDDNSISNFFDDLNASGSGVIFTDDQGDVTLPG